MLADDIYIATLLVLGLLLVVASLDDLIIDVLLRWKKVDDSISLFEGADPAFSDAQSEAEIAVFVANWHEADVLEPMISGNIANLPLTGYRFVLGVYPNDYETLAAAKRLEANYPSKVSVIVNRLTGPTSKGQMLNEMFSQTFDKGKCPPELVVIHDSEDLISAKSFDVFRAMAAESALIQIPVFSLDSRQRSLVGASYMEEFAERHTGEMILRSQLGAFVPSAGVGTGLRRDLIEHMLDVRGLVMQSGCVTEDYILGAEAHAAGFKTTFAAFRDPSLPDHPIIATLEYFPKDFSASVKQKSRWVYGIAFESAARLGWNMSGWDLFFSYRDRKGSVANFLPFLSFMILCWGLYLQPDFSKLGPFVSGLLVSVLALNTANVLIRYASRASAMHRVYRYYDLIGIVLRWPVSLVVNAAATVRAWRTYIVESGFASRSVSWAKTAHELPVSFDLVKLGVAGLSAAPAKVPVRLMINRRQSAVISGAVCALLVVSFPSVVSPDQGRRNAESFKVANIAVESRSDSTRVAVVVPPGLEGTPLEEPHQERVRHDEISALPHSSGANEGASEGSESGMVALNGQLPERKPVDRRLIAEHAQMSLETAEQHDRIIIRNTLNRLRDSKSETRGDLMRVVRAEIDGRSQSDGEIIGRARQLAKIAELDLKPKRQYNPDLNQTFVLNRRADATIAAQSTIRITERMDDELRARFRWPAPQEPRVALAVNSQASDGEAALLSSAPILVKSDALQTELKGGLQPRIENKPVDRSEVLKIARVALDNSTTRDHEILQEARTRSDSSLTEKRSAVLESIQAKLDQSISTDAEIIQRATRLGRLEMRNLKRQWEAVPDRMKLIANHRAADAAVEAASLLATLEKDERRRIEHFARLAEQAQAKKVELSANRAGRTEMTQLLARASIKAAAGQDRTILQRGKQLSSSPAALMEHIRPYRADDSASMRLAKADNNRKVLRYALPPEAWREPSDGNAAGREYSDVKTAQTWANAWLSRQKLSLSQIGLGSGRRGCRDRLCTDGILGPNTLDVLVYIFKVLENRS